MNATQRVEAALAGETIDRPLFSLWKHFPLEDRDPQKFIKQTISFQEQFNFDFIKISYNGLYCVEDWGTIIEWPTDPQKVGRVVEYPIKSSADWNKLNSLSIHEGAWGRELEVTKEIMKKYKGKVPVLPTVFSPLTVAWKMCGENLLMHMEENPDDVHRGLAIITETSIQFVRELLSYGVDGLFFPTQLADFDKTDWQNYETFGKRYDMIILEEVKQKTWFNMLHIHGLQPMFDELKDYPVEAINWHDRKTTLTLEEGRKRTDKLLAGGIDEHDTLTNASEEELVRHLDNALAQVGDCKIALGPGCVVPLHIPDSKLELLGELVNNISFVREGIR